MQKTYRSTSPTGATERIKRLPLRKRIIKLIGRGVFIIMTSAAGLLRPRSMRVIGNGIGSAFYVLSKRYRDVALNNLREAYKGEKSEAEIRKIAKGVFHHFTRGALEFFYLLSLKREQIDAMIDTEGIENLKSALDKGKGCIVVTAHYGNWELMARKMAIDGYKVNVIARDSDDPGMTGITTRIRESGGYRVFDRDQPIIGAFRALKNNEILGILPDQNASDGIFVDFFGRPAKTAEGPAVLSLKSGAPIVPMFAYRTDDDRYTAVAYPAIDFEPTGNEEEDVRRLTELVTKAIEDEIRRRPSQWLWLHNRWKLTSEAERSDS